MPSVNPASRTTGVLDARALFSGSGPGAQTTDGCSVDLYRRLSYRGELDETPVSFAPGVRVLDLGCGTGRFATWLLERGCRVTAVDNSADMLAQVPSAATRVHADIERLALETSFDCVLLASGLINHPEAATRRAFLHTARRHLVTGGHVLVQSQNPHWLATAEVGPVGENDGLSTYVESVDRSGACVSMTLRYEIASDVWRQSFTVVALDVDAIDSLLVEAGFAVCAWFGAGRRWVAAVAG